VLANAGEGGAWGIALLAAYSAQKSEGQSLVDFLGPVFADSMSEALAPDPADVDGFEQFFERYRSGLPIERAAVDTLK